MKSTGHRNNSVHVQVLDSLGDLGSQWDRLVDIQPLPSPFLKSWWIQGACEGQPTIVCVMRNGRLIGGAAFEVRTWGPRSLNLQKIVVPGSGLLAPDHIDLIAEDGAVETVARAVLGYLLRPGSRLIELDGLAAEGTLARLFSDCVTGISDAPFAPLPSTPDEYLRGRPGKVRSTIKRRTKKLLGDGAMVETVAPENLNEALRSFAELHDGRWSEESGFLDAIDRFRTILSEGMRSGEVLVSGLRLQSGEMVAMEVDFEVAGRLSFYQSGRRTDHEMRGCGSVLRFQIIEAAIDRGIQEYDLLRGEEPYKAEWATAARQLTSHRLPVGPRSKLVDWALSHAPSR
ncbi:MAG: GNAT family N-acetyltransferase [Microthrixaceae bacterium]